MSRLMHTVALLLATLLGCAAIALAATQPTANQAAPDQPTTPADPTGPRFGYVDIFIDSGDIPLAVYQIELQATTGDIRIVGVEGSDSPAFATPPHYDPAALQDGERIVLGAFSTQPDLPLGKTRIARVHLRIIGPPPTLALSLTVAGDADANPIDAKTSFTTTFQTQNGSNP